MSKQELLIINRVTYELYSCLGQGGSAVVWKARHVPDDGQVFAIKRIKKDKDANSARNQRFDQEIKYGQNSNHPNVVRIHTRSADEKYFYYVMDFYPLTLRNVIEDETDSEILLDYTRQLCDALAYVHEDDIAHRDIKPENVLVDPVMRRLVLADFGIAHFKDSTLTNRGDLLANRNYLAPEQMVKGNALSIGKPADVFALGIVITEMFTKQNARGRRHVLIRDLYPYLGELDLMIEQMLLQDDSQRLRIDSVRGLLRVVLERVNEKIAQLTDELSTGALLIDSTSDEFRRILDSAARDVLSAKQIFEQVPDSELIRFNNNYHCEIAYSVSAELFNTCAQTLIYSSCKAKFDYEGNVRWGNHDDNFVLSEAKPDLLDELEAILADFPLPESSPWSRLPRRSAHLFRFCKDYHCRELLSSIRESIYGDGSGSLKTNLVNAPILWITHWIRLHLSTDFLKVDRAVREELNFEDHVSVSWNETFPLNPQREAVGNELLVKPLNAERVANTLEAFETMWNASVGQLVDGEYSVIFRSQDTYHRFRHEALSVAESASIFEADVLNLFRPEMEAEDLVALTWGRDFDVNVTLAKVIAALEQ